MIDFSLTDAQREVQRTARAFAEREILPRIQQMDASAEYDRGLPSRRLPSVYRDALAGLGVRAGRQTNLALDLDDRFELRFGCHSH